MTFVETFLLSLIFCFFVSHVAVDNFYINLFKINIIKPICIKIIKLIFFEDFKIKRSHYQQNYLNLLNNIVINYTYIHTQKNLSLAEPKILFDTQKDLGMIPKKIVY